MSDLVGVCPLPEIFALLLFELRSQRSSIPTFRLFSWMARMRIWIRRWNSSLACERGVVQARADLLEFGFVGVCEECCACVARLLRGSDYSREGGLSITIPKVRRLPSARLSFFKVPWDSHTNRVDVDARGL